jgi:hypothetical protein
MIGEPERLETEAIDDEEVARVRQFRPGFELIVVEPARGPRATRQAMRSGSSMRSTTFPSTTLT